ncbi:MAG: hypothetical protein HY722_05925 [Planctomycetes bacterium]|nr:hypothetical protein [Planctomycetota bacterium]
MTGAGVVVYTKDGCSYSAAALAHWRGQGVEVEERNVQRDPRWAAELEDLIGRRRVPVVVRGEEVTVGFGGSCSF